MGKSKHTNGITEIAGDLHAHPAVRAWTAFSGTRSVPQRLQILKECSKSGVYRLAGIGPRGQSVCAKWAGRDILAKERYIYQDVLPNLPLSSLHCYGLQADQSTDSAAWLFVEDAGEDAYDPAIPEQLSLFTRWLATLHTAAASTDSGSLPDTGEDYYFRVLKGGAQRIADNRSNPALQPEDVALLDSILAQLATVESNWPSVTAFCRPLPRTLVHGDIARKNVRLRPGAAGPDISVFDWEMAGWGVPAADIAGHADISAYQAFVEATWPMLDEPAVTQLRHYGRLFRTLAAIDWDSLSLRFDWVSRTVRNLRSYHGRLTDILIRENWSN
jgi:thiamine kinase-like enzyme